MKPRLRIGLCAAFAAISVAIVLAFAADVEWRSPWQPEQRLVWDGASFLNVSGSALEDEGRLRVEGPGVDATAVQSLAVTAFEAEAHPLLRYRFDGLPETLAVSFAFRRADTPDQLRVVELPWPKGGTGSFDLAAIPDWRGTIEEIGFAEFSTPQVIPPDAGFEPFALVEAQLWSPSWRGSLAALGSAWFDPWPWTTRSVHALGRDGANFRQWSSTVTFAVLAALIALWWVIALRWPPRHLLPVLATTLAVGWVVLDVVWASGLHWRTTAAQSVYGELDGRQRTQTVPDRDLVEVAQQIAWLLRNEPDVPILIHARSGYPLYRLIWHLLPRNAFALAQAMEAAPSVQSGLPLFADGLDPERVPMLQGEVLRPGSVLVFFNMPQWQFDPARGVVSAGDVVLPGEQLLARDRLLVVRYRGVAMSLAYLGAWLLPTWAGAALIAALLRPRASVAAFAALLGCGYLVGLVLIASIAPFVVGDAVSRTFEQVAPWLIGIACGASPLAWMLCRRWPGNPLAAPSAGAPLPRWLIVLVGLMVLAIAWRLWGLASEALLRPTFPWDAWAAWQVKPKAWYLADRALPFVAPADWLLAVDPQVRTLPSWRYPDFLTWLQLWYASAAGGWIEPAVNLAWTGALAALALAAYGQWRALGVPLWLAVALVWGLLSLPLVEAHVALAGYADLWLMAMFGVAVLAGLRWARTRERAHGWLALSAALCLPLIKLEGAVWAGVLITVSAWTCLSVRTRWGLAVLAVACVVFLAVSGWAVPVPGIGEVRLAWGRIELGTVGSLDLYWRPVGEAVVAGLFHLPNWHLLWYLLPVLIAWRWRDIGRDPAAAWAARVLGVCVSLLFVLFFFTDASSWAVDYTSANRLVMQIVPAVFALAAVLLSGAATAGLTGPAKPRVFQPR